MKSMTGYGRGECILYNRKFVVEIKAVNHRYNDITIKMPRTMLAYEDAIKKTITSKVFRGKIDVYVNFESFSEDDVNITINENLAKGYIKTLNYLKDKFNIEDDITLDLVAKFPDLIAVDKGISSEEAGNEIFECLMNATNEAVDNFVDMRIREGEALKNNILEKLETILDAVNRINTRAPEVAKDYRKRLEDKLNELEEIQADESRILTEVLIFSDKACIDEEITRLYSHIKQMKSIVMETVPVGRKLDFLIQEMNREVNTIGSKSNDLEITNMIVDTKSEIEKIREQIQNIE
ncbi:MAG: YicC/YloC family endoribonuclease [Clostridia bacterium]|nr:YicC/YloC family endoribonuclease [Clostridia bacterium]